jgi:hypothetical protein
MQFWAIVVLALLPAAPRAFAATEPSVKEDERQEESDESDAMPMNHVGHRMSHSERPTDCSSMETWDYGMGMCMPRAMTGMPMRMLMVHGNAFLNQTFAGGPRGRQAFTVPDMFMVDAGTSVGDRHYVNWEFMGTLEKWTYPGSGTPELLQIGEDQANGRPFLDAQHPHSTPIMGLTLSDTISFGSRDDHAKIWFSPRGESTEGPVAFMHRPTGMVNPDAPLGHHVGQDVGHISGTVIGAAARVSDTTLEVSAFHGTEPQPTKVDLPISNPNSFAARWIQQLSPHVYAMGSAAFVKSPEPADPDQNVWRYSASVYGNWDWPGDWKAQNAIIWGHIIGYDRASSLNSLAEELWLQGGANNIWCRVEVLQRTPGELIVSGASDVNTPRWVTAATLGYTRDFAKLDELRVGLGGSVTEDFLPSAYKGAYGGNPFSGKIFLQLSGMKMWDL